MFWNQCFAELLVFSRWNKQKCRIYSGDKLIKINNNRAHLTKLLKKANLIIIYSLDTPCLFITWWYLRPEMISLFTCKHTSNWLKILWRHHVTEANFSYWSVDEASFCNRSSCSWAGMVAHSSRFLTLFFFVEIWIFPFSLKQGRCFCPGVIISDIYNS